MLIEYDSFSIAQHYNCAIEYGDFSGLSENDDVLITDFLENLPTGSKTWQFSDDTEFCKDDISGLMADCLEVKLFMNHADI